MSYSYDSQGNISVDTGARSSTSPAGSTLGAHTYAYDGANNLRFINKGAVNQNEYAYDGLNQRVWTNKLPSPTANNPNPSTAVKTYEIYSSNGQLLTEYTPSQGKVDEHIYLGTKRIGLASRRWGPAPTQTYFHLDPAATPLLATTGAGTVAWKENHRPYGDKLNNPANASSNTIGYAGKPYDNARVCRTWGRGTTTPR